MALAVALAGAPRLLVLDEPTSSLDTVLAYQMRELLADVLRDGERAAVLVSHDPGWVAALADEVIRLDGGRITASGAPEAVSTDRRSVRERPWTGTRMHGADRMAAADGNRGELAGARTVGRARSRAPSCTRSR